MSGKAKQTDRLYMRLTPDLMDVLREEAKAKWGEIGTVTDVVKAALYSYFCRESFIWPCSSQDVDPDEVYALVYGRPPFQG